MERCTTRGLCSFLGLLAAVLAVVALAGRGAPTAQSDRADGVSRIQTGLASFYGPGFHGRETASGETFDQRDMTAAHRRLPLGAVVRVTNLENGRNVILRITDRGPYGPNHRKGTIIDVSKGAARQLDFIEDGLTEVRVEVLALPESDDAP